MEQNIGENIESLLTQDNFSLNHDVESDQFQSALESSGRYNSALQCPRNGEAISLGINEVLLNFATSQSTEGTKVQQDPGLACFNDLFSPEQISEGDFGPGNGHVSLETNLTNTYQQPIITSLQNQSGCIDSHNEQECFNQIDVDVKQQNKINNVTSKPSNLFKFTQNNEDKFHSVPIYQSEYRLFLENKSKTIKAKKRRNAQVHF